MGYVVQRAIKSSQTDDAVAMDPMSTIGVLLMSTSIGLVCLCGSFWIGGDIRTYFCIKIRHPVLKL